MTRFRIGTVGYLNAAPLTNLLDRDKYEVVAAHPRGIATALRTGEVDIALVPAAAALTDGDLRILPGWCIGADGPVASVVIAAETEPEDWTEVVLDGSSRTSVTLARLLLTQGPLSKRVRSDLVITDAEPGDGPKRVGGTVAAVVIGDPARALPAPLRKWDLAELWKQWTGRPFVFAVWAGRADLPQSVRDDLRAAGAAGVADIPTRYDGADRDYLRHNLRYTFDESALMGLRRYAALAFRAGLIGTSDVRFYEPSEPSRPRAADVDTKLASALDGAHLDAVDALTLLRDAPGAELLAAANLRRLALHPERTVSYLLARAFPAELVAAGGAPFDAAILAALSDKATTVVLSDLGLLDATTRVSRLRTVRASGLDALGVDVDQVDVTSFDALRDAGLAGLSWRVTQVPPIAALAAARAAGLPVDAEIWIDADGDLAQIVSRLLVARTAAETTGALTTVSVHLALPSGALVEPGRPTPSWFFRTVALARLLLGAVPHISGSPRTQGVDASQAALAGGADDLGVLATGVWSTDDDVQDFPVDVDLAERAMRVAGFEVVRRGASFEAVGGALTSLKRVRPVEARARAD